MYQLIDKTHSELVHFEEAMSSLKKSCELFDIQQPDSKPLMNARKELKMAKVCLKIKYQFWISNNELFLATLGLLFSCRIHYWRLEENSMEKNRCWKHGYGM